MGGAGAADDGNDGRAVCGRGGGGSIRYAREGFFGPWPMCAIGDGRGRKFWQKTKASPTYVELPFNSKDWIYSMAKRK